ncbi:MAG: hypothetical protein WAQ28_19885 [Bacteroidia bacterium]|jgi:hypothetical protein
MKRTFLIRLNLLIALLFGATAQAFACKCESLGLVTKEACEAYNVIFTGRVDSVSDCSDKGVSVAYFTIDEVYKGSVNRQVQVEFDCASSCLMSFARGESWLMYTNYEKFDLLVVNLCSYSRKFFADSAQDIYLTSSQQTFEQEKDFLRKTLGIQAFKEPAQSSEVTGRNEQPSGTGKLILLGISFLAMVLVYFIINRKKNVK